MCDFQGVRTRRQFLASKALTTRAGGGGGLGTCSPRKFEIQDLGSAISYFFRGIFSSK